MVYVETPCGRISSSIFEGIENYVHEQLQPGGFLTAVICNDAQDMVKRASNLTFEEIKAVVIFFSMHVSSTLHGSQEKMESWLNETDTLRVDRLKYFMDIDPDMDIRWLDDEGE